MLHVGCHLSSAKGYEAMGKVALSIGANTFQFFTRNPRGSKAKAIDEQDISRFLKLAGDNGFGILLAHAPYTLNPCSADPKVTRFAAQVLQEDLALMEYLPGSLYNFHLECEDDIQQTIDAVKALGCKVGLTIKPGTAPEALAPYLDQLDLVLVMSVEPGFGGQKFMPSALEKLRWLKEERAKRSARYLLEVDGGVDDTTAPLCVEAGADILVAGSAVFGAADPAAAVRRLAAL